MMSNSRHMLSRLDMTGYLAEHNKASRVTPPRNSLYQMAAKDESPEDMRNPESRLLFKECLLVYASPPAKNSGNYWPELKILNSPYENGDVKLSCIKLKQLG
nr:uncharacterized protein LOC109170261 [Ipomoea batatas]